MLCAFPTVPDEIDPSIFIQDQDFEDIDDDRTISWLDDSSVEEQVTIFLCVRARLF